MARERRRVAVTPGSPADAERRAGRPPAENLPRPTAQQSSIGAGLGAAAARKRHPFAFLRRLQPRFVADVISELRKVTWPSFNETRYLTFVVAVVSLAVGVLLGSIDLLFGYVIERMFF